MADAGAFPLNLLGIENTHQEDPGAVTAVDISPTIQRYLNYRATVSTTSFVIMHPIPDNGRLYFLLSSLI
jgi:hypothetical protein